MMPSQQQRDVAIRDQEIARLQNQVKSLSNQLESAMQQQRQNRRPTQQQNNNKSGSGSGSSDTNNNNNNHKRTNLMSPHAIHIQQVDAQVPGSNRSVIRARPERIGRSASISTQRVMASLPSTAGDRYANNPIAIRILDMFQRPNANIDYLNSEEFAKDLFTLCTKVRKVLEREPRVVYLQSPCYIFGDIHGNLEDLHFFSDNIWRLGMSLTAGNFLFLGDYVDRGMSCMEVIAYLLSMKLQNPHKVFLLRGNHETRDVNGWEEHYGERSFIWQCRNRFDDNIGYRLWEACNQVFDRLPLAAVVDQDIFCVHGGIPRPVSMGGNPHGPLTTRIQDILNVPKVAGINPPYVHENEVYQQVASDCIWSDPASEEQEMNSVDPRTGYGESLRGGGAICFGSKAVTEFLQEQGFSYIMRAHEAHAEGVAVSKGARVFTVFSTSKDHNQGSQALAGCILVDNDKLQVINRSPAYKNQYVHRRDSVSLQTLSHLEIAKRIKLGLVTPGDDNSDYDFDDEDYEEWQDDMSSDDDANNNDMVGISTEAGSASMNPNSSETRGYPQSKSQKQPEQYTLAQGRRSSIDLTQIVNNMHDSQSSIDMSRIDLSSFFPQESSHSMRESLRSQNDIIRTMVREDDVEDYDEDSTVNGDDVLNISNDNYMSTEN
jgi:diadenosine tetraphosphatase ApaH/serine/threonine PP2A family protein phosphatase